jgi:hypothetical protein
MSIIAAAMIVGVSRLNAAPTGNGDLAALSSPSSPPSSPPDSTGSSASSQSSTQQPKTKTPAYADPRIGVPSIGSVQVLNGCGAEGAAMRIADFLRSKNFDVKDIGNAPAWNHPATMVISRTADMGLAKEIEKSLKTGMVVMIRNGDSMYDVTVVAGPDFEERIK